MCALRFSRILKKEEAPVASAGPKEAAPAETPEAPLRPEPSAPPAASDPAPVEPPAETAPQQDEVFEAFSYRAAADAEPGSDFETVFSSEPASGGAGPEAAEDPEPTPAEAGSTPAVRPPADQVVFDERAEDRSFDDDSIRNIKGIDNIMEETGLFADYLRDTRFYDVCLRISEMLNVLRTSTVPDISWQDVKKFVSMLEQVVEEELGAFWLEALNIDFEELNSATEKHNINACIICFELARVLKYSEQDQRDLAGATLIYNTGSEDGFPAGVQGTTDEKNIIDRSMNVAKKIGAPADVLRAVSECNERVNGSGTPLHLQGTQISVKGQLLGLSIEFEKLFQRQRKEFQDTGAPFEPVMEMLRVNRDQFSPNVLKGLLLAGGFYQVGAIVELNSGALARVISQNRGAPLRPLVEIVLDRKGNHPIKRQIIDLRENASLSIVKTVTKGS